MKKLLQLFGILDLIAFATVLKMVLSFINDQPYQLIKIGIAILGISFIVSGFLLIKKKTFGIYLNYIQFIPRLMFNASASFGFIYLVYAYLFPNNISNTAFFALLVLLEFIRLGITVLIHRRILKNPHHEK